MKRVLAFCAALILTPVAAFIIGCGCMVELWHRVYEGELERLGGDK